MQEREYQKKLIKRLLELFPGCLVIKADPLYIQGVPDLLILWKSKWAALEVKKSKDANIQPNQTYFVRIMNEMSFARFICPETEEVVLNELQQAFRI